MIAIVWTYEIALGAETRFRAAYGPDGDWARLFARAPGFVRTELLVGPDGRYATLDYWDDLASFEAFMAKFDEDYDRLDAECEALTEEETRLGVFEVSR